jgi:hypothetical protein
MLIQYQMSEWEVHFAWSWTNFFEISRVSLETNETRRKKIMLDAMSSMKAMWKLVSRLGMPGLDSDSKLVSSNACSRPDFDPFYFFKYIISLFVFCFYSIRWILKKRKIKQRWL